MEDLVELNLRLAQHHMGSLNNAQQHYLKHSTFCLACLRPAADELKEFLARPGKTTNPDNPITVASINREYLHFARLAAKDILSGKTERLVETNIDWEQAELLAGLSGREITHISLRWPGLIYDFASTALERGAELHPAAARFHAMTAQTENSIRGE